MFMFCCQRRKAAAHRVIHRYSGLIYEWQELSFCNCLFKIILFLVSKTATLELCLGFTQSFENIWAHAGL